MAIINLEQLKWTLSGWRPFAWKLSFSMETGCHIIPDVGPINIKLPSSVQAALLHEGIIPDWNVGLNSRECEWVEHRHWEFSAVLDAGLISKSEHVCMKAQGLDYSGWIYVDKEQVCKFHGTLIEHCFDLTKFVADGKEHCLRIIFEEPPREQGQIGYTSHSHFMKPRFNYSWDWCPRFVPIGIWGTLKIEHGRSLNFELKDIRAELEEDNLTAQLSLAVDISRDPPDDELELVAVLTDGQEQVGCVRQCVKDAGEYTLDFNSLTVEPWWPNMMGPTKLYKLEVFALSNGQAIWSQSRKVGFKRIKWSPCPGAPTDAKPWKCEVNGTAVFLQGINWTPLNANYIDTPFEQYKEVVSLYRDMGCNIFRVWGGAIIEKEDFYRLCDEQGILIWQEFPLSSSGIENYPPEEETVISELATIAKSYVNRLKSHASLLLWSGGNELTEKDAAITPIHENHPCIVAMRNVVEEFDAGRRFVETSPSGPCFLATPADYGKGLHHDVHGPWGFSEVGEFSMRNLDSWRTYWMEDDSLLRSEVGMPGAANLETIQKYDDGMAWPPEGEYWNHTAMWWTQWDQYKTILQDENEQQALLEYVHLTQKQQADAYEVAAVCCKKRFPECGGFIIWMGHDSFPCPANNSVIDYDRKPKPAYYALKNVFRNDDKTSLNKIV